MMRLRRQQAVDAHIVADGEKLRKGCGREAQRPDVPVAAAGAVAIDFHAEAVFADLRHIPGDVAAADQAETPARQLAAHRLRHSEPGQQALAGLFVDLRDLAGQVQHHGHGVLRHGAGVGAGGVFHGDAAGRGGLDVDAVKAGPVLLDQTAALGPPDHVRRAVLLADDDGVQLLRAVEPVGKLHMGLEPRQRGGRNGVVQIDFHIGGPFCVRGLPAGMSASVGVRNFVQSKPRGRRYDRDRSFGIGSMTEECGT